MNQITPDPTTPNQTTPNLQSEVTASPAALPQPTLPAAPGQSSLRTRIGKIARLPLPIREQLNHRLLDNEPAPSLVSWLNSLPEVQAMLAELFAGRPIIDQSIYEWKQGGFADWVAQQSSLAQVWSLAEQVRELDPSKSAALDDHLASLMLANLFRSIQPGGEPRPEVIHSLVADLQALRRSSSQAAHLRLDQQHLDLERQRVDIESQRLAFQQTRVRFENHRLTQGRVIQALEEPAPAVHLGALPAPSPTSLLPQSTPAAPASDSGSQPG